MFSSILSFLQLMNTSSTCFKRVCYCLSGLRAGPNDHRSPARVQSGYFDSSRLGRRPVLHRQRQSRRRVLPRARDHLCYKVRMIFLMFLLITFVDIIISCQTVSLMLK